MEKYVSESKDLANSNLQLTVGFSIGDGSKGALKVSEPLLTSQACAEARATALLLDKGHIQKKVTLTTYHVDDISLADIISVHDILYVIETIRRVIINGVLKITITAIRYE